MSEIPPPPSSGSYTPPPPPPSQPSDVSPPTPPPDGSIPPPASSSASDRGMMLLLAYAGPGAFVPFTQKKNDADLQWHSKNGLMLFAAFVVLYIVLEQLFWYPYRMIRLLWLIYIITDVAALVKATNNGRLRIPLLTDFAEKL